MMRKALLPVRVVLGTAKVSARAGYATARGSARAGYVAGRAVGYGRLAVFSTGVAVGVIAASPTARRVVIDVALRIRAARRGAEPAQDQEVADQVRRRLERSQATAALPQPDVEVTAGLVVLQGEVDDAQGRRTMGEVASEVDGVREVDNRIVVIAA